MLYFPENNVSREQEMLNRSLNRINALLIRTQAEYSKQEHFYRSLLEEVPSGVLAWDSSGKIMMANSAALTLLGLPATSPIRPTETYPAGKREERTT